MSYDQVVLPSEHKEGVLCKSSNMSFLLELQLGSKSLRVSFCYMMSPHLLSDDVAHRGEGSMKGSCQIIQVTSGVLDELN